MKTKLKSKSWDWNVVNDPQWSEIAQEVYPLIKRWKEKGYKKVLDLGCGVGRHSLFLAENGFDVQACDLSEAGIKKLNKKIKENKIKIKTTVCDMSETPYGIGYFDAIIAFRSIYHTDDVGIRKVLNHIFNLLKVGGEALVTFNSKNSWSFKNSTNFISKNTIIKTFGLESGIPHFYANKRDIKALLKDFEIKKFWYTEEYWPNNTHTSHYFTLINKPHERKG